MTTPSVTPVGLNSLRTLTSDPLWYLRYGRYQASVSLGVGAVGIAGDRLAHDTSKPARKLIYAMVETLLDEGCVALGGSDDGLYDWNAEREPVDVVVIHHSNRAGGITARQLDALELIRLWVPTYAAPTDDDKPKVTGKPIYSGNLDADGRQSFAPYHWIVRQDGSSERLLADSAVGWHAGDITVNVRSIGICLDDDLAHKAPNAAMLTEMARIIREHYPWAGPDSIKGHKEVAKHETACPGDQFDTGVNWKNSLVSYI